MNEIVHFRRFPIGEFARATRCRRARRENRTDRSDPNDSTRSWAVIENDSDLAEPLS